MNLSLVRLGQYRERCMFVKICGITNEDDALLVGGDGSGRRRFRLRPGSTRQIAAQVAYDITRRLPAEILTVGVFRDELPSRVVDVAHRAGVKAVQLHGRETPPTADRGGEGVPMGDQGVRRPMIPTCRERSSTAPT